MNGFLLIDKPAGITSHDVVQQVRRSAQQKKVGHAGTLDPLATGVLIVALGKATRLLEYLEKSEKIYQAGFELGVTTDTDDSEGEVLHRWTGDWPSQEQLQAALQKWTGEVQQKVPNYSAVKQGGEALYKKARRGEVVEAPTKTVTIFSYQDVVYQPPKLSFTVHCSKGTYIRSLARDIGAELGTGAIMTALRRVASGQFTLENALSWEQLQQFPPSEVSSHLLPLEVGASDLPRIEIDQEEILPLQQGKVLTRALDVSAEVDAVAVFHDDQLIAILQKQEDGWHPHKVFQGTNEQE